MRQAWRGLAGLIAAGALAAGGSAALADGGGGGRGGGGSGDRGAVAASIIFTMTPADRSPEGVAFDRRTQQFFVSRTGTGAVWAGRFGTTALQPFIPGVVATPVPNGPPLATGLKVRNGLLYVAGASTGQVRIYQIANPTKPPIVFETGGGFINDLVVTGDGDVFATDSNKQAIYRIDHTAVAAGSGRVQTINVSAGIPAAPGFNLNGIVRHGDSGLIVVQSNTGKLFQIMFRDNDRNDRRGDDRNRGRAAQAPTTAPRIEEIVVPGGVKGGDGLLKDRGRLLVTRGSTDANKNGEVDVIKLRRHRTRATVESVVTDDSFTGPSTIARTGNRLLVVNANFGGAATATQFTVTALSRNAVRHGGHGGRGGDDRRGRA
jgi:hypothetical protein